MSFARVAGGLLTGLGKGMQLQEEDQQKQADNEALLRRQMALAKYGNDLDIQKEGVMQSDRLALTDRESRNKLITTSAELQTRSQMDRENDARTAAREAAKDQREFEIWRKKQPIELQSQLTLEDFKQTREDARDTRRQDAETTRSVSGRGVDAAGNLVVAMPGGRTQTYQGVKPIPNGSADPFAGIGDGSAAPTGRQGLVSASPPPPPPPPSPPANTYTAAEYNQTLSDAAMDPRFKGMSSADIKKSVDQALRARGLRLAPNGG